MKPLGIIVQNSQGIDIKYNIQLQNYYGNGKWLRYHMKQIFKYLKEWNKFESLILDNCGSSQILKQISQVKFISLKGLYLWGNQIISIQNICLINFPAIQSLCIGKNKIVNLQCLRKCSVPYLQNFSFNQNPIFEMRSIIQMGLQNIRIIRAENQIQKCYHNNMNWLARIQSKKITTLDFLSDDRISQKCAVNCLKMKFIMYRNICFK